MFERVNNDQPRTNNSKEAFHRAFQTVSNSHSTILRLIGCLWKEKDLAFKGLVDLRIVGDERK